MRLIDIFNPSVYKPIESFRPWLARLRRELVAQNAITPPVVIRPALSEMSFWHTEHLRDGLIDMKPAINVMSDDDERRLQLREAWNESNAREFTDEEQDEMEINESEPARD